MMRNIKTLVMIYVLMILVFCIKPTFAKYVIKSEVPMKVTISIDKQGPTVEVKDINNTSISNNGTATEKITISYNDDLSGIQSVTYKYNSSQKNFTNIQAKTLANSTTFTQKGWYEITAIDKVGNKTVMYIYVDWAVARINQIYYRKLEYAINAAPTNNTKTTIVMLKNVSEVNTIQNKKNIVLDIDKTTITGSFTINSGATFQVEDGTVNNKSSSVATFKNSGTLTITSGTYTSTNNRVVSSNGTINITGGTLKNTGGGNVVQIDAGTANLSGGNYQGNASVSEIVKVSGGTTNIKGTNITSGFSNVITLKQTAGTVNMSSGTISCTYQETEARAVHVCSDSAKFNMTGGTISGYTGNMCTFEGKCVVNLTGGTIQNISKNEFTAAMSVYWGAQVTIDGASIKKTVSGRTIYIDQGIVYFKKGTISSVSFTGNNCECIEISDDTRTRTSVVANFIMTGGTATANGASPVIRVREGGKFVISRRYGKE